MLFTPGSYPCPHPMLVPCPFLRYPSLRRYPSPGRGYPSLRRGVPPYQDRTYVVPQSCPGGRRVPQSCPGWGGGVLVWVPSNVLARGLSGQDWGIPMTRTGVPPPPRDRTAEQVLTAWRAVCLLRSCRRTVLL